MESLVQQCLHYRTTNIGITNMGIHFKAKDLYCSKNLRKHEYWKYRITFNGTKTWKFLFNNIYFRIRNKLMERRPSWEANGNSLASQEIPHLFRNLKVHYRVPPFWAISIPFTLPTEFLKICFNIILSSSLGLHSCLLTTKWLEQCPITSALKQSGSFNEGHI